MDSSGTLPRYSALIVRTSDSICLSTVASNSALMPISSTTRLPELPDLADGPHRNHRASPVWVRGASGRPGPGSRGGSQAQILPSVGDPAQPPPRDDDRHQ